MSVRVPALLVASLGVGVIMAAFAASHAVAQTVPDLSGGGANETSRTGTTVGTVSCPLSYGQDVMAA